MFVVIQEDHCGYEDGYSVQEIYGPFSDNIIALEFVKNKEAEELYGVQYSVRTMHAPIVGENE